MSTLPEYGQGVLAKSGRAHRNTQEDTQIS